jgi:protein O-mannosyl-transferase
VNRDLKLRKQGTRTAFALAIIFCVYVRSLGNGFVFDDHVEIVTNRYIGEWSFVWKSAVHDSWWFRRPSISPQSAYYRPVQNAALAAAFQLAGRNPFGWHLIKIALHLIAVGLVFRLATLLTDDAAIGLLAALLFGFHPVHVESVVWAAAIPEPLASVFIFGAFCCFARRSAIRGGRAWAVLLFAGAAFSHEGAVAFPLLITLYAFLFESSDADRHSGTAKIEAEAGLSDSSWRKIGQALRESAPFYGASLLYLFARAYALGFAHMFGNLHRSATSRLIDHQIVQVQSITNHSAAQLLTTVPLVMVNYIELLFLPWRAGPAHPACVLQHLGLYDFYVPLAGLALSIAIGWVLVRHSPRRRVYIFCAAWFLVGLAPAMNFDQVVEPVQDRYLYLPSFAWCVVIADCAVRLARSGALRRRIAETAFAALIVLFIAIDWNLEPVWHDDLALFSRCVADFPNSATYRMLLSQALEQNGDLPRAARQLAAAVQLEPDNAGLHHKLGALYRRLGREAEAQKEFDRSMALFAPWASGNDTSQTGPPPANE